jgi:hypothetical protein
MAKTARKGKFSPASPVTMAKLHLMPMIMGNDPSAISSFPDKRESY